MRQLALLVVLIAALEVPWPAYSAEGESHPCEAETAPLMTLSSSWAQIYAAAKVMPQQCFDGYFAEGISDTLVRKMKQDWSGFHTILDSHPKDKKFMRLVLRSINATLDPVDIRAVDLFARKSCPSAHKPQCRAISKEATAALAEVESAATPNNSIESGSPTAPTHLKR